MNVKRNVVNILTIFGFIFVYYIYKYENIFLHSGCIKFTIKSSHNSPPLTHLPFNSLLLNPKNIYILLSL